jgi:hypothetical protein
MNTLATLSSEQLDQLYDWLLEMPVPKVVEKIAQPAPYGFGVQTYITTLQRFKQRRYAELAADQLEAAKIAADTSNNAENDAILDTAIATTLKRQLFARASAPDATNEDLALLARYVQRNEKLKIDIQRVQIARERLAQNNRRLDLHERAQQVREKTLELRREELEHRRTAASQRSTLNSQHAKQADQYGPVATNWEEVGQRVRKIFGISEEESKRRAELRKTWKNPHARPGIPEEINPVD